MLPSAENTVSRKLYWTVLSCWLILFQAEVHAEPQQFALIVGVKEYPASEKLTRLVYTEPDAFQIGESLKKGGFNVTLMTQAAARPDGQQRFAPNAAFIRKQFADLVGTPFLRKEDCLIVVLEGHGIQLASQADAKKQTFYFCPADALIDGLTHSEDVKDRHNLIPVQELYDTLKKSSAGVRLLIVDACRNDPNQPDVFRSPNSLTRPPIPTPPGGIATLFSCSENQRAAEDPDLKHGVFSYYLIEALSGKGDLDGDKRIDITELYKYVGGRTYTYVRKKYSRRQLPEFQGDIKGWAPLLTVRTASIPDPPDDSPATTVMIPGHQIFAGKKAGDLWEKNSLKMKFRWCPPNTFTMGSPPEEVDRKSNEDQVKVILSKGYWMGQFEVTQAEYAKIINKNPSTFAGKNGQQDLSRHPVETVTWEEAMEFCKKLTLQERTAKAIPEDWEFTLPTEAQWESACRAGNQTTATAFGNSISSTQANFDGTTSYNGGAVGPVKDGTVEVGQYSPNQWGLHDLHGNVFEWCRDWYSATLPAGADPVNTKPATLRISRGGSWYHSGTKCRSAYRNRNLPDNRDSYTGFRVVLVPVSNSKP